MVQLKNGAMLEEFLCWTVSRAGRGRSADLRFSSNSFPFVVFPAEKMSIPLSRSEVFGELRKELYEDEEFGQSDAHVFIIMGASVRMRRNTEIGKTNFGQESKIAEVVTKSLLIIITTAFWHNAIHIGLSCRLDKIHQTRRNIQRY